MSINITVHGNPVNLSKKNIYSDMECVKRLENDKRKRIRLEQVRQQSKDIASKIRSRVNAKREEQLKYVEKVKADEMKQWRQNKLAVAQKEYNKCISSVGAAHEAATKEPDPAVILRDLQRTNRQNAVLRYKESIKKSKGDSSPKKMRAKGVQATKEVTAKSSQIETAPTTPISILSPTLNSDDDTLVDNNQTIRNLLSSDSVNSSDVSIYKSIMSKTDSSSSAIDLYVDSSVVGKKKTKKHHTANDMIDSDQDNDSGKSKHKKSQPQTQRSGYNPLDFTDICSANKPDIETYKSSFTQVSDLLKNRKSSINSNIQPIKAFSILSPKSLKENEPKSPAETAPQTQSQPPPKQFSERNILVQKSPDKQILNSPTKINKTIKNNLPINKTVFPKDSHPITKSNLANRPLSQKSLTKKSVSITTAESQAHGLPKVQYYDHPNRFSKEYSVPENIVTRNERPPESAMASAAEEIRSMVEEEKSLETFQEHLRQRESVRSMRALEKEQVRRDYELLSRQLDVLSKEENHLKSRLHPSQLFSEENIKQQAAEHQRKLNEAFENVLHKPILITCPKVDSQPLKGKKGISDPIWQGINVAAPEDMSARSLGSSTSDSCHSILLGYVDEKSKEVNKDVNKCKDIATIEMLNDLLKRINIQKNLLIDEIEKNKSLSEPNYEQVTKFLKKIDNEREEILVKEKSAEKKHLEKEKSEIAKREEQLRMKELQIKELLEDIKLKENMAKKKQKDSGPKMQTHRFGAVEIETRADKDKVDIIATQDSLPTRQTPSVPPVQIVIKLPHSPTKIKKSKLPLTPRRKTKLLKTPYKSDKEKSKKAVCKERKKIEEKLKDSEGKNYPRTPKKDSVLKEIPQHQKELTSNKESNFISSNGSVSTTYYSPPAAIGNLLSEFIQKYQPKPICTSSEPSTVPIQPSTASTKVTKHSEICEKKKMGKAITNPVLKSYITRLLGMSRQSIDNLGVSSATEISTPSSSIINVFENIDQDKESIRPSEESESSDIFTEEKITKLQKFIDENYSFLSEMEESIKEKKLNSPSEKSMQEVEKIWMNTLEKKEKQMKKQKVEGDKLENIMPLKPALKKKKIKKDKVSKVQEEIKSLLSSPHLVDAATSPDLVLLQKYSELTENYNQRISNLSEMIIRVRQEKQRLILENTLSSCSTEPSASNGVDVSTQYKELPQEIHIIPGSSTDLSKASDFKSHNISYREDSEKTDNIKLVVDDKHPEIGKSRDSGICMSRPLTSSEIRDSPDVKEASFEQLLKDIPKVSRGSQSDDIEGSGLVLKKLLEKFKQEVDNQKHKPPSSLVRFSPELIDRGLGHELSTIAEVETPATSRLNASLNETATTDKLHHSFTRRASLPEFDISTIRRETEMIKYQKFPTFEEYARLHNLSEALKLDRSKSLGDKERDIIKEVFDITSKSDELIYRKFPEFKKSPEDELLETSSRVKKNLNELLQVSLTDLSIKKFPSRREYFQNEGLSEITDSIDLEATKVSDVHKSSSDDTTSLPDVVAELKRRNIIQRSFHNSEENSPIYSDQELWKIDNDFKPSSHSKDIEQPRSPKKKQYLSRITTPEKQKKKSLSATPTKTKSKLRDKDVTEDSERSAMLSGVNWLQNDSSSDGAAQNLEKEFNQMGMKWAANMIRKTQESQLLSSTSSSPLFYQSASQVNKKEKQKLDIQEQSMLDSFIDPNIRPDSGVKQETSSSLLSDESGTDRRPLNLKEFLARELIKRTANQLSSTSSMSTSSGETSTFTKQLLKSLFNLSNPLMTTSHTGSDKNQQTRDTVHRTSTPVSNRPTIRKSKSNVGESPSKELSLNASNLMFSGESRISSIRPTSSSETDNSSIVLGSNKENENKRVDDDAGKEPLKVPLLKLNISKYQTLSSSSNSS